MYSTAHPTTPVEAVSDAGSYSVKNGVERLPEIEDVPYLDVTAALDDSKKALSIFCVNRSLECRHSCRYCGTGVRWRCERRGANTAERKHRDENDDDDPERVAPVTNQEKVSNGHMQHTFPHESVTVITLHARNGR